MVPPYGNLNHIIWFKCFPRDKKPKENYEHDLIPSKNVNIGKVINIFSMLFKRKYDENELECRSCHKKVKPIKKRNSLKDNFYGQSYSGIEKKYLIICPNCKVIIGTTDKIITCFFYYRNF